MVTEEGFSGSKTPQDVKDDPDLAEIIDQFYQQVHSFLQKKLAGDLLADQIEIDAEVSPDFELKIALSIQADISPFSPIEDCQPILDEAASHAFAVLKSKIAKWQTTARRSQS
ncbi:MAG: hypothetical protein ACFFGZ_17160 [Candidatus Thorarchaeota archaeon]